MESLNLNMLLGATEAGYGPVFQNDHYNLLIAQIEGSFNGLELELEGRVDPDGTWEVITGWSVSDLAARKNYIREAGIYEFPIEAAQQLRFHIVAITRGSVSAYGVLYDGTDGSQYPTSQQIPGTVTFGDPTLFVKGVAEQIFFDPSTGNIIGYDKTATEAAVNITVNLAEITGGMLNKLIGVLPDTARISGTYTSSAFSLETREKIMGGQVAYNAVSQVCDKITAESAVLSVTRTPAPALGEDPNDRFCWCYVSKPGEPNGTNFKVDSLTGMVQDFYAEVGETYEVTYFCHKISARMLPAPSVWNPVMMTVQERFGVYSRQNGSAERGILKGWLYFIVPRAILNADAGVTASQTAQSDTQGSWVALPEKPENMPFCDCSGDEHPLAYYVYVPCSDENEAVISVVSVGNGLTLKAGRSAQLPIKYVMRDDSLVQPDFTRLGYYSENEAIATVDNCGVVTAVSEGETIIHAYLTKLDGTTLDSSTVIAVDGTRSTLTANRNNILVG